MILTDLPFLFIHRSGKAYTFPAHNKQKYPTLAENWLVWGICYKSNELYYLSKKIHQ